MIIIYVQSSYGTYTNNWMKLVILMELGSSKVLLGFQPNIGLTKVNHNCSEALLFSGPRAYERPMTRRNWVPKSGKKGENLGFLTMPWVHRMGWFFKPIAWPLDLLIFMVRFLNASFHLFSLCTNTGHVTLET